MAYRAAIVEKSFHSRMLVAQSLCCMDWVQGVDSCVVCKLAINIVLEKRNGALGEFHTFSVSQRLDLPL
jgi:hypothetical protein